MNLLVFGASGGTGRELVKQALAQGCYVTAFVRDPTKFKIKHAILKFVPGDVADYQSVAPAVQNQDAAICALGSSTPLKRDPTLIDGVRHIITAMEHAGVPRLIYLSFLGVRDGRSQLVSWANTLLPRSCCITWLLITKQKKSSSTGAA